MNHYYSEDIAKSPRIQKLIDHLYAKLPVVEADRAVLLTESYKTTEGEPMIIRRAKAFDHICRNIPIIIRPDELIVGSSSQARGVIGTVVLDGYSEDELRSFAVFAQVVHQLLVEVAVRTERKIITPAGNRFEVEKTVKSKIGHDLFAVVNLFEIGVQYGGVVSALFQQACHGSDFA